MTLLDAINKAIKNLSRDDPDFNARETQLWKDKKYLDDLEYKITALKVQLTIIQNNTHRQRQKNLPGFNDALGILGENKK
jgi:hypothetical protein